MKGNPGNPATKKIKKPFVPMERDFEHHRFWPTQTGETFIKAIAFEDLWLKTETGPRVRYVEGVRVELGPGQCIIDERTLAARWKWSRGRVRRFLDDLSMGGEAALERYHWGTKVTLHKQVAWWGDHTANSTTDRTGDSTTESPVTVPPSIPRRRDIEIITPGGDVDKSVDNSKTDLSLVKKVAEIVDVFHKTTSDLKARVSPPRPTEKHRIEKAVLANGGDHIAIRECVREVCRDANAKGDPATSVSYGIAAWERRVEKAKNETERPASRREPQERPLKPTYHGKAQPAPTRELSDEEQRAAVSSIGDILSNLTLPSNGGKK